MLQTRLLISAASFLLAAACSTSTTTQASSQDSGGDSSTAGADTTGTGAGTTSSGGTTSGGGSPATGGTSSASTELSCSTYCARVQGSCLTESVKQYKSMESCVSSCAAFLLGSIKDSSGNTLGCRAHYAELAAADPVTNCAAAGPSGGGHCGTNCDAYCALMARICPTVFDDDAGCRTECLKMVGVDEVAYRYGLSGNNLQCRIYHTTFGAEGFPEIHCPHASPVPLMPCAG